MTLMLARVPGNARDTDDNSSTTDTSFNNNVDTKLEEVLSELAFKKLEELLNLLATM